MRRVLAVLVWLALWQGAALAADRVQLHATAEDGFGRLVLEFRDRVDLPKYKINFDNNVLAIIFTEPVTLPLPDLEATLPDYLTIGRVDPDGKGVRFGMRKPIKIHSMEAGEKLFVDMMPSGWQGLPPSLPEQVVAELSERAKTAAIVAEQKQKAEQAKALNPIATMRIGRNPTFVRVEIDWNVDTKAVFTQDGAKASIKFDWPVPVDLYTLKADLPHEIQGVANNVTAAGSSIDMTLMDGVVPRFYGEYGKTFTFDIDLTPEQSAEIRTNAEQLAAQAEAVAAAAKLEAAKAKNDLAASAEAASNLPVEPDYKPGEAITPVVETASGTVRVKFPFQRDTASAVFRRGDTLWMLFDTRTAINDPASPDALSAIASSFTIVPAGDTQIVRVDLSTQKLATLASEGRSWVLSVGDVLLNATEPLQLHRKRDQDGQFAMTAEVGKPYRVHSFRDPVVGDLLDIVTAFPPARGTVRDLSYVDFDALRSVHGLIIRPDNNGLDITIDKNVAMITAPGGLTLSDQDAPRSMDSGNASEFRDSFVDLGALSEPDPAVFVSRREELSDEAAAKEGQAREVARLNLAQYYVGNQFAQEAIGVLHILEADLKSDELRQKVKLTDAMANILAARPADALTILNGPAFTDEVDAVMWRAIARADVYDYVGARTDALASESIVEAYPVWVQQKFYFAGIRSAIEASDLPMAQRYLDKISFAQLDPESVSLYQLLQGRIAEAQGHPDQALESYGLVIGADFRPTRAEAVYRTLLVLKATGRIDLTKATATLSAEAMLWRGNPLEIDMQKLLAELYFENKDYRFGFEVTRDAAKSNPDSKPIEALMHEAEGTFDDLFLNGAADALPDLDALSLYYDFRQLTPAGTRGDEMIRNLARRLVKVDLLSQAADLLEYQIDSRLTGVAQAQVASDLALVRIADRNPEGALRALNRTRLANLPPSLERQRRILEARALIDSDREDLALDLLSRVEGRDADLLRVDGFWKIKNYVAASGLIENAYSETPDEPLTSAGRMNLVKAAVGLALANDNFGLSRLRSKFSERMAQSSEWPVFNYLTGNTVSPVGVEFKQAAKMVAETDSVTAFLSAYRQIYPSKDALTPTASEEKSKV
ncbi:MAG: hypothetical protein ABIQ30_12555 [Devosia sp.]